MVLWSAHIKFRVQSKSRFSEIILTPKHIDHSGLLENDVKRRHRRTLSLPQSPSRLSEDSP